MTTLFQRVQNVLVEAWYDFHNPKNLSSSADRNAEVLLHGGGAGGDFEAILHSLYNDSVVNSRPEATVVNLACLHRVALHRMQRELVREAMVFKYRGSREETVGLGEKIGAYVQALKDHTYIRSSALNGSSNDPFIISTDIPFEQVLIYQNLEKIASESGPPATWSRDLTHDLAHIRAHPHPHAHPDHHPGRWRWNVFGGSRTMLNRQEAIKRFAQRLGMAVIGGAFLIAPMHIMVLHPSQLTSLVTTSVSVLLFGVVVAVVLERMFDVLSVTAAYTAVLVVFVGTSMGGVGR
ncbi:hypothetical protein IFR05_007748 [Cadophora sp. M221]|nr:hypothetical protein IFR05_007748 [Cadophora sp. M221]